MVYTIFLGKQGKRVYTIDPERRVYHRASDPEKEKQGVVSTLVVYIFFLPVLGPLDGIGAHQKHQIQPRRIQNPPFSAL